MISMARSARSGSDQSRVSMRSEVDWGTLAANSAPTDNNPTTEISTYLRMVTARFIANRALLSCRPADVVMDIVPGGLGSGYLRSLAAVVAAVPFVGVRSALRT